MGSAGQPSLHATTLEHRAGAAQDEVFSWRHKAGQVTWCPAARAVFWPRHEPAHEMALGCMGRLEELGPLAGDDSVAGGNNLPNTAGPATPPHGSLFLLVWQAHLGMIPCYFGRAGISLFLVVYCTSPCCVCMHHAKMRGIVRAHTEE